MDDDAPAALPSSLSRSSIISTSTGLSFALVVVIASAAMVYGRQAERLDAQGARIDQLSREVSELRGEIRSELRDIRALLIAEHTKTEPPKRTP